MLINVGGFLAFNLFCGSGIQNLELLETKLRVADLYLSLSDIMTKHKSQWHKSSLNDWIMPV